MLNVNNYLKSVIVEIETFEKIVQKDSLKNGCEIEHHAVSLDFKSSFNIDVNNLNYETLKQKVLKHLNNYFYNVNIDDIFSTENYFQYTVNENNDSMQLTTESELKRYDELNQLYLCDYLSNIKINGIRFSECEELFKL